MEMEEDIEMVGKVVGKVLPLRHTEDRRDAARLENTISWMMG